MRELLMNICPSAIWTIVVLEAVIAVLLFMHYRRERQTIALLTFLVTLGLILDALIIGVGSVLETGLLGMISPVRFIAHGILIPLLFPVCGYALGLRGSVMRILWIFTAVLMIAGAAEGFSTVLELKEIAGVIRYVSGEATPAWAELISRILSFGTVIPMMIIGVIVWIRQKTPFLFLSGFLMFVFSALGPATGNADLIFFISMFGELFMVLFLYLYVRKRVL
ncbi:MAG: hypothetical protein IIZ33_09390 [Erysipelotrichaceae bacterium]|nr:hypothetical protein [Erysipelotrichaceae bacterium]